MTQERTLRQVLCPLRQSGSIFRVEKQPHPKFSFLFKHLFLHLITPKFTETSHESYKVAIISSDTSPKFSTVDLLHLYGIYKFYSFLMIKRSKFFFPRWKIFCLDFNLFRSQKTLTLGCVFATKATK